MSEADTTVIKKTKSKFKEPSKWKVIILNDNVTTVDFVVTVLTEVFNHSQEDAFIITMEIHDQGSGVAGFYSHEIAEAKAEKATHMARENKFPLQIKISEEK